MGAALRVSPEPRRKKVRPGARIVSVVNVNSSLRGRRATHARSSDMRASAGNRGRPFGHVSERATQRLEAENALVLVRRSCRGGARALPRHSELLAAGAHASRQSGHLFARRPRFMEPQPIGTARIHGRRRLHRSPAGDDAACERPGLSQERIGRRRASEAGARASTSREAYRSTRVVGAERTGPSRSASDAVGEQPGRESGGSHRVRPGCTNVTRSRTPP